MLFQGQTGPTTNSDGTYPNLRLGKLGDGIVSELHGRFYEQVYRGNTYCAVGSSNAALVAANAIATGLTATAQPIIGVWNPSTSLVNLVILQATVTITTVANTAVSNGGFMWVYSIGNTAVSTGSAPVNCKTFATPGGSSSKTFSVSTALTGLTNNLTALRASAITSINAAGAATAVSLMQGVSVENVDGGFIVPPGGVLGIMGQVSTTTLSVSTGLLWEEVPV